MAALLPLYEIIGDLKGNFVLLQLWKVRTFMRCFILWRMWVPRGNVPCIIRGIIHAIIRDTCRHRSGPLIAGFQPTAIPTPLRPRFILLESVQKPSTIMTSDYIKFPAKTAALSALLLCIRGETVIHVHEAGL